MGTVPSIGSVADTSPAAGAGSMPVGGNAPRLGGPPAAEAAGSLPLRRLTAREYNNTVAQLLGDTAAPARSFASDPANAAGFTTPIGASTLDVENYFDAADTLAKNAVKNLGKLLPCDPAKAGEDACARTFVETFGRKAWRRPLEAAEIDDVLAIYQNAHTSLGLDYPTSVGFALQALLVSPKFLYRWEVAPSRKLAMEAGLVRLTPHQVASRLSYFLTGSTPDDMLLAAADANQLGTQAEVTAHARRLLAEGKRAGRAVGDFFLQWLEMTGLKSVGAAAKSSKVYPQWTGAVRDGAAAGLDAFVNAVVLDAQQFDGKLSTLLSTPAVFVTEATAPLVGISGVTGTTLVRRDADPKQRAGLFTQVAFLAAKGDQGSSHPTKRGHVIWRNLLCGQAGQIPADVPPVPVPNPKQTTRQRFEEHDDAGCAVCHRFLDPLGFAFENYDGIGRYQTMDNSQPVDAGGAVTLPGGTKIEFANAIELMARLAGTSDLQRCVVQSWFEYGLGRAIEDGDAGSLTAAFDELTKNGGNLRELLVTTTGSKTFLYRKPSQGEVLP